MNFDLSTITISDDYLWNLGGIMVMGIQYMAIGQMVGVVRRSIFSRKFMKKHFGEEHKQVTGQEIQAGGYPDMGEGRYSKKLPQEKWIELRNAQRAHQNYKEWITIQIALYMVAALFTPTFTFWSCVSTIIGRILYTGGYKMFGPKGRTLGAAIYEIPLLLNLLSTLYFSGKLALGY